MDRRTILEAIDACRPGTDDLNAEHLAGAKEQIEHDPRLSELRRRAEKLDETIQAAFHDVPLPEGLQLILLERLESAGENDTDGETAVVPAGEQADIVPAVKVRKDRSRRSWLIGGAMGIVGAAATVLAAIIIPWTNAGEELSSELLAEQSLRSYGDEFDPSQQMTLFAKQWPPTSHPISGKVWRSRKTCWRSVLFLKCSGVVYDLGRQGGASAMLFVIDPPSGSLAMLPTAPPRVLDYQTGGRGCAVWTERGKLCLLVIDGNTDDYQLFVPTRSTVA